MYGQEDCQARYARGDSEHALCQARACLACQQGGRGGCGCGCGCALVTTSDAVHQKFGGIKKFGRHLAIGVKRCSHEELSSEASTGNNQRLAALLRVRSLRSSLAHALVHALRRRLEP